MNGNTDNTTNTNSLSPSNSKRSSLDNSDDIHPRSAAAAASSSSIDINNHLSLSSTSMMYATATSYPSQQMMNINPNYMNNTSIPLPPINTDTQLSQAHGISQPSTSVHPFDTMTQDEHLQTMQRLESEVRQMQCQVQLRQMYSELQFQQQQMKSLATICEGTSNIYSAVSKKEKEEEKKERLELPKTNFKQIVEIERRHSADLLNNSKKRKAREDDSTTEPSTKNIKVSRAA